LAIESTASLRFPIIDAAFASQFNRHLIEREREDNSIKHNEENDRESERVFASIAKAGTALTAAFIQPNSNKP
jgi:hypothetical protein